MSSQPLSDERSRILESCGDPWWYQEYIAPLFAEIDRLKEENARLHDALMRRSGSSSWEEFAGIWDPTEEAAVDAVKRLHSVSSEAQRKARALEKALDILCPHRHGPVGPICRRCELEIPVGEETAKEQRKARALDWLEQDTLKKYPDEDFEGKGNLLGAIEAAMARGGS